jgi:rifampicin phosphotransferase
MREDALSDVGLAWPLMRRMLLELGRRLRDTGAIEEGSDVFWLGRDELHRAADYLDAGQTRLDSLAEAVEERKMLWRGQRRATPPQLLPEDSWFMVLQGLMPAASDEQTGDTIRGVGASQGRITAPANVLHGSEDFGRMRPGEVLVAGITTPAWTPLFAVASAVVTDVGGPLSHSSIVAREYGIPAVLGTGVATRRIRTGQTIQVDGDAGTVTLLDGTSEVVDSPATETAPRARSRPGAKKAVLFGLAAGALVAATVWWRYRRSG